MGDSRGEAGGRDREGSFILVFSFLAMRFQQLRVHILFSFVLFYILILQAFDIVVSFTGPNTAVQSACCWSSLTKSVSLFPVLNTRCQKCTFLLSWLDLDRHSLQSQENKLI